MISNLSSASNKNLRDQLKLFNISYITRICSRQPTSFDAFWATKSASEDRNVYPAQRCISTGSRCKPMALGEILQALIDRVPQAYPLPALQPGIKSQCICRLPYRTNYHTMVCNQFLDNEWGAEGRAAWFRTAGLGGAELIDGALEPRGDLAPSSRRASA